jgi:hypothetical protein
MTALPPPQPMAAQHHEFWLPSGWIRQQDTASGQFFFIGGLFRPDQKKFDSDQPRFDSDQPRFDSDQPRFDSDQPRFDLGSIEIRLSSDQPITPLFEIN